MNCGLWAGAFTFSLQLVMTYATSTSGQGSSAKWADYGIFAVRYNARHTHIDLVRACADNGPNFGPSQEYARATIVNAIKQGTTFVTVIGGSDGKWHKGQPVYVVRINGTDYIKTVNNGKEEDNLGDLPEF